MTYLTKVESHVSNLPTTPLPINNCHTILGAINKLIVWFISCLSQINFVCISEIKVAYELFQFKIFALKF